MYVSETMADWDEAKLEEVVTQKHAESDSLKPKTDIVNLLFPTILAHSMRYSISSVL